jgi:hypothetical protein
VVTDTTFSSKFRLWSKNFTFVFQSCNLQIITNLSKTLFCIQVDQQIAEISSKEDEKRAKFEKSRGFLTDFLLDFWEKSGVFQYFFDDISAICWPIIMQNSVLDTSLVVDYMPEIRM